MLSVSKQEIPLQNGDTARYVKVTGFKDAKECEIINQKIQQIIKEWNSPQRVFG
jgi:hypothetical protein